jgi:hypothetical protein
MMRIDVTLNNGDTDACIGEDEDVMTITENFIEKGVPLVGAGEFMSVYPSASVFSFTVQKWEE